MKKYGLQLRVPPAQQKKPAARPPLAPPRGFREDDDDENDVEREILRQAAKNKSLKDIEEQHKKALEEDPSVFDYDGVYDQMKEETVRPVMQDREERKPKYIQNLLKKAEKRKFEQEIVYERKLAKERNKEDHLYADKDKFVTGAYKKKLAEQAKWMEEERLRQLREEKEDVTKKSDLSDFYFNLGKNVAFGAKEAAVRKQEKLTELSKAEKKEEEERDTSERMQSMPESSPLRDSPSLSEKHDDEISPKRRIEAPDLKSVSEKPVAEIPEQENASAKQPSSDEPKRDHHKRSEDAVAAARERFLARKRAKDQ
ncbi:hypothetical protein SLE2022_003840 [Rubroshorea leprosula]